jgi:[ribosomal protein S18]-alanine N-acetyltransferase
MGTPVITVRPMTHDDLAEVAGLEADLQARPWSEQVFHDELDEENRTYVVAIGPEGVVGYAGVMVIGDEAHVTNLAVAEESRRRGIGKELMVSLILSAVDQGARHLTLEVRTGNESARALYAGLGLAPVGVRQRYYGDDDALILWVHDIDRPEYLEGLR